MTEFVMVTDARVLVVMPDGYRVWPDPWYDGISDSALLAMVVDGTGENGERVTVRGNHIARVGHIRVRPLDPPRDEDPSEGDWESEGGTPADDDDAEG